MLAAIFIVPIVYFINAFFIGRFIKRFKISMNPFLCTIIGFFSFFTICYIFDIFLYCANANIWTYIVIYSIIQAILLIFYIINWKRVFITFSVNWKKIATFFATFAVVMLISWACLRDFNSQFGQSWIQTISEYQEKATSLNNIISFRAGQENNVLTNLSALNIFNIFWINCFNINGFNNCLTFCNWSWMICGAGMMACITTWLMPDRGSITKVIYSPLICICYLVVIQAFIESFAICDMWLMILIFVYLIVLFRKESFSYLKLSFLTILLLSFISIGSTSFYIVICLWLFSVYWAIRNKENSINYLVCLSWPIIMIIFGFASAASFWLYPLANAVCLAAAIIFVILFARRGSPVWSTKVARSVARNSGKIVYTCMGIIIAAILVANFFIFHEVYQWGKQPIDYKLFLTFTYNYIWNIPLSNDLSVAIINGILYVFFIAMIVVFIILRNVKTTKLYPIVKDDSAIKLAVASAVLFIDPLVIHVLNHAMLSYQWSLPLNTLDLNGLFVAPLFVALLRLNHNLHLRKTKYWAYDWC